jgi:DNA-binding SARP family transcriptional activator
MEAERYGEALELYRGDLLEAFHGDSGAAFQDWVARERDLLRATAAKAARALAAVKEDEQRYTPAVAAARRAVQLAEADERTVRDLLQLLDRLGDRAGAVQAYEEFARRLAQDLDVEPAAETKALMERIRSRVTPAERLVSRNMEMRVSTRDAQPAPDRADTTRDPGLPPWIQRTVLFLAGAAAGSLAMWMLLS